MAPGTERPPSEQGIEYALLDELQAARPLLEEVLDACRTRVRPPNWWDILPGLEDFSFGSPSIPRGRAPLTWNQVLAQGVGQWLLPTLNPAIQAQLRMATYTDRLELTLLVNGCNVGWQRALFFQRPPSP